MYIQERIRYCHNKKCEVFNMGQGDSGCEELNNWACIGCERQLTKKNNKNKKEW